MTVISGNYDSYGTKFRLTSSYEWRDTNTNTGDSTMPSVRSYAPLNLIIILRNSFNSGSTINYSFFFVFCFLQHECELCTLFFCFCFLFFCFVCFLLFNIMGSHFVVRASSVSDTKQVSPCMHRILDLTSVIIKNKKGKACSRPCWNFDVWTYIINLIIL